MLFQGAFGRPSEYLRWVWWRPIPGTGEEAAESAIAERNRRSTHGHFTNARAYVRHAKALDSDSADGKALKMSSLESPSLPSRGDTRTDPHNHHLVNGRVTISPYDPKWPYLFQREADRIRQVLGDRVLAIEHIGSTAVPGLDAKACIDIRLAVADPTDEPAYLPELEGIGYSVLIRFEGEQDHRLLKGSRVNVSLYVGTKDCPALERMSLFRDHLTADAGARERYAAVKRELGEREWERLRDYTGAKTEIITELMAEAEAWKAARSPN